MALETAEDKTKWNAQLKECGQFEKEKWTYDPKTKQIIHLVSKLCLDKPKGGADEGDIHPPTMKPCSTSAPTQRWDFIDVEWKPKHLKKAKTKEYSGGL